jgi:tetratricopeptide (TPR) repeat protein
MTSAQTVPLTNERRVIFGMGECLGLVFLLLAVLLAYGNTLVNDFTMDDNIYVLNNPMVTNFSFRAIFESTGYNNVFRPLMFGSMALNWFLGGGKPLLFHLFNLLLHATVTLLLYFVLRKLLEQFPRAAGIAWVAALIFAVLPIHTEAVASVSGCSELLAITLLLGAWWLHLKDRPILTLVCFVLGVLAKESAVVFIPLVVIGDYVRGNWKSLARYGSVAAVAVVYLAMLRKAQGGKFGERGTVNFLDNPLAHLPAGMRMANALRIAWRYVGLHVYPANLSCDYSYNAIHLYSHWEKNAWAIIATILVVALWVWTLATGRKQWFLAGAIYICGFSITANILMPTGTILGERLAYLPSAGFCLLVALAWIRVEESKYRKLAWVSLVVIVVGYGVRTVVRNRDWHDNFTLFSSGIKATPGSAKMHSNMALQFYFRGEFDQASAELTKSLEIFPDNPDALGYKGLLEARKGNDEEAVRLLKEAISTTIKENPNYDFAAVNLAAVKMKMGKDDEALKILEDDIALWPRSSRAHANRGVIFYRKSELGRARVDAETALKLEPANEQAANLIWLLDHPNQNSGSSSKP